MDRLSIGAMIKTVYGAYYDTISILCLIVLCDENVIMR